MFIPPSWKKENFRELVTADWHKENEKHLRKQALGKEKCERIMTEPYGKKTYFGKKILSQVRNIHRTRLGLLPSQGITNMIIDSREQIGSVSAAKQERWRSRWARANPLTSCKPRSSSG